MDEIFDIYNQQIGQSKSSIFTKEDVLKLFSEFYSNIVKFKPEEPAKVSVITSEAFDRFASEVDSRLNKSLNDSTDLVDYSSAEFSVEYDNRLCLDNIDVQTDVITEFVNDILLDEFEKHFGKVQE